MKDFHTGSLYRSGWRPLAHEEDEVPRTDRSKPKAVIPQAATTNPEPTHTAEPSNTMKTEEILLQLTQMDKKLDALSKCMVDQTENINRLLLLAKTEETTADNSRFHLFKNRKQPTTTEEEH